MNGADEIRVPAGTILFRQGDSSDSMFVVAEGRVRLTLGSGAEVREIGFVGPGDFFGEVSLLSGAARTATAEVVKDSRLLVVGRDAFNMLVQDDLAMVMRMLNAQGERLARANNPIQDAAQRLARVRVVAHALRGVGAAVRIPWRCVLEDAAADLHIPADALVDIVAEFASRGAGTLGAGRWDIATPAHVDALIAALAAYAG
jgi:CRP/FNR family cyclic AMP-dependent transcriptional regulator